MNEWLKNNGLRVLLAAVLALLIVVWITAPPPPTPIDLRPLEKQIRSEYDAKMTAKDAKLKSLMSKIGESEMRYRTTSAELAKIKEGIENVRQPQTRQDLVDRFGRLGYPVLPPAGPCR